MRIIIQIMFHVLILHLFSCSMTTDQASLQDSDNAVLPEEPSVHFSQFLDKVNRKLMDEYGVEKSQLLTKREIWNQMGQGLEAEIIFDPTYPESAADFEGKLHDLYQSSLIPKGLDLELAVYLENDQVQMYDIQAIYRGNETRWGFGVQVLMPRQFLDRERHLWSYEEDANGGVLRR